MPKILVRDMLPPPELLNLILCEFQRTLRENLEHPWETKHGHPPKFGYVEHKQRGQHDIVGGPTIEAWSISCESVRSTPIKTRGERAASPKTDGMFYDLFAGWFWFSDDFSCVFINWQTGPRFGRGFRHRVGRDTSGEYLIDRGKNTWVS